MTPSDPPPPPDPTAPAAADDDLLWWLEQAAPPSPPPPPDDDPPPAGGRRVVVVSVSPPHGPTALPECVVRVNERDVRAMNDAFPTVRPGDVVFAYPLAGGGWSLTDPAWQVPGLGDGGPDQTVAEGTLDRLFPKTDLTFAPAADLIRRPDFPVADALARWTRDELTALGWRLAAFPHPVVAARGRAVGERITYGDPLVLGKNERAELRVRAGRLQEYPWDAVMADAPAPDTRRLVQVGDPTVRPVVLVPFTADVLLFTPDGHPHPHPGLYLLALDAITRERPEQTVRVTAADQFGLTVELFGVTHDLPAGELGWGECVPADEFAVGSELSVRVRVRRELFGVHLTRLTAGAEWERVVEAAPVGARVSGWHPPGVEAADGFVVRLSVGGVRVNAITDRDWRAFVPPDGGGEFDVTGHDPERCRLVVRPVTSRPPLPPDILPGRVVSVLVVRAVEGGLEVSLDGRPAFLPQSQIDLDGADPDDYLGQTLECQIEKVDPLRHNIVVSRRRLQEVRREAGKGLVLSTLAVGQVRRGVVKNVTDYGAFIDLGGFEALLHKTNMSWGRVTDPRQHVHTGQELDVYVLEFDAEKGRAQLSLRKLLPDPWPGVVARYPVGSRHTGPVVNVVPYGAFVLLEPGVEGLVHISELSWTKKVVHATEVVTVGDRVEVQVLTVNHEKNEIGLSLKQCQPDPWGVVAEKYPPGTPVSGVVRNLTSYGAFVEIEEGIDGLLHVSDMVADTTLPRPHDAFRVGQTVECVVKAVDAERRRVALTQKPTLADPWDDDTPAKYPPGRPVRGVVGYLVANGVNVVLEPGLLGWLPATELPDAVLESPDATIAANDELRLKVLSVDPAARKITLTARHTDDPTVGAVPADEVFADPPADETADPAAGVDDTGRARRARQALWRAKQLLTNPDPRQAAKYAVRWAKLRPSVEHFLYAAGVAERVGHPAMASSAYTRAVALFGDHPDLLAGMERLRQVMPAVSPKPAAPPPAADPPAATEVAPRTDSEPTAPPPAATEVAPRTDSEPTAPPPAVEPGGGDGVADRYPPGARVSGRVLAFAGQFAVVEIEGGGDGLLPAAEMSWMGKVNHPNEMAQVGDTLSLVVTDVDRETKRISLSLRRLTPDPWESDIPTRFPPGTPVSGVVKKVNAIGASVDLGEGLRALLPADQLPGDPPASPVRVLEAGQQVTAAVLHIDPVKRTVKLTMRGSAAPPSPPPAEVPVEVASPPSAVADEPQEVAAPLIISPVEPYQPGERVRGTVVSLDPTGVNMKIADGVAGWVPVEELPPAVFDDPQAVIHADDELDLTVLSIDADGRRTLTTRPADGPPGPALAPSPDDPLVFPTDPAFDRPAHARTALWRMKQLLPTDERKEAAGYALRWVRLSPTCGHYVYAGQVAERAGDLTTAERLFDEAYTIYGSDPHVYAGLLRVREARKGTKKGAKTSPPAATPVSPENAAELFARVEQLTAGGAEPKDVVVAFRVWAEAVPTAENYLRAAVYAEQTNQFGQAEYLYYHAKKYDRQHPDVLAGITRILERKRPAT